MDIKEHMEVIGADGVHVGTVDKVEGGRIKLTKRIVEKVRTRAITISSTRAWLLKSRETKCGYPRTRMSP